MKKFILCTLYIVPLYIALVFTSCNSNNPTNPDELNIKDYVGTTWFLDSVNVGDFTTTHLCQPIFLLSETSIQIGNDVCPFRYEKGKLYIKRYGEMEYAYELVSLDEKGAVVNGGGDAGGAYIYYISALPTLDRNKQNAISESALISKYKQVISSIEETAVDGSKTISYSTGGMILWINLKADHKMVYEDSNPYIDDTQGYWDVKPAERLITWGGVSSYNELISMNHWENIIVFNEDYLVTGEDYDYQDGSHRHYESVLLRVK